MQNNNNIKEIDFRELFTETKTWSYKDKVTIQNANGVNITYTPCLFNSDRFRTKELPEKIYVEKSIGKFKLECFDMYPTDTLFEELLEEKISLVYDDDRNIELPNDSYWQIEWSKYWYHDRYFYSMGREAYYEYENGDYEAIPMKDFKHTLKDVVKGHLINSSDWDDLKAGKKKLTRIVPSPTDQRISKWNEWIFSAHNETLPVGDNLFIKYKDRDDDDYLRFTVLVDNGGGIIDSGEEVTIKNPTAICHMTGRDRDDLFTKGKLELILLQTTGVISAVNPETNESVMFPAMFDKGDKLIYVDGKWEQLEQLVESRFIEWNLFECKFVKE